MKTVIRVEHPDSGKGIWSHYNEEGWWNIHHKIGLDALDIRHQKFNTPEEDGIYQQIEEYCAFKSIEQIQQWIMPEEFTILFTEGFRVLMLDISKWKEGDHQIVFNKKDILQSKDISSLFIQSK